MWQDVLCIHSHPQIHNTALDITPGNVHFSLGVMVGMTFSLEMTQLVIMMSLKSTQNIGVGVCLCKQDLKKCQNKSLPC